MDAMKKINWKQPKYMIPIIIYFPLLFVGYFVIDPCQRVRGSEQTRR